MHKNRTLEGIRKQREIEATYIRWWLGKGIVRQGKVLFIENVRYIGNSVYGGVMLTLSGGAELNVSYTGFRPRKSDLELYDYKKHKLNGNSI